VTRQITHPLEKAILRKLLREHCIQSKHILEVNICNSFERHQRGDVKDALKSLVKQQLVVKQPTVHGNKYFLPPYKLQEIKDLINSL